ncbi:MAG: DUF2726 domain-containing protein [Bacilli bacterium]|nr:DUF2726 domain-containing protein [Bacilli bacterium]
MALFIIIVGIFFLAIAILISISKDVNNKTDLEPNQRRYIYSKKKIMTESEKNFYLKLRNIEKEMPIIVHPQICLASIIKKENYNRYINELFKIIDFAIFNEDYSELLLLIELNDQSHNYYNRKKRDSKVKEICESVDIKLISFYTSYANEESYMKQRILKEIGLNNSEKNEMQQDII